MKEKEEKSKKLEEKVDSLIKKIENEENKIKRLGYVIRCKMLIAKLEREINLQNAKESFEKQKDENGITAREEKVDLRTRIINTSKTIKSMEADLKRESEYDYKSSKFIFPEEEVASSGGIFKYIKELSNSGIPEQENAAEKIKENIGRRRQIEIFKEQLAEQKEQLNNIDKALKKQNGKVTREETALVVKSKFNIFAGIRSFANSVTSSVKEFFAEFKENREIDKDKAEELNELQNAYEFEQEKIRKEYEAKMEKLEEKRSQLEEEVKGNYKNQKDEKNKTTRNQQARDFKDKLQNMAKENPENHENPENEMESDLEQNEEPEIDANGEETIDDDFTL